ncbi:Scr1 family TA system antitoxin-like transcriptional regulator [Nocardia spumae]|uniref:Scr1 family TA system antitoxin-like transcriptional regulator n=1 Tax=Nocardia spumae TaxID=2887190 RepID=UPI001D14D62A|nr:Scr1 family TA system antitoxin-like transcriptional regulator [Nocardia spumae]
MTRLSTDSNVARRMLGLTLEAMREQRAISREAAADAIGVARSTLWKIETGQTARLNPVLMNHLCDLCGAGPKQTQVVLELVKETNARGWWQAFAEDAIPKEFGLFVSLEFPLHPKVALTIPPVVYVQGFLGDLYLEQADEIRQYREVCAALEQLALDEVDSRALILEIAKEYHA